MLRALLEGPARKIYCGTGLLLLLLLPLYYAVFPRFRPAQDAIRISFVLCLATLSYVFAFLQDEVALSGLAKTSLALCYAVGTVTLLSIYPWLIDVLAAMVRYARWGDGQGMLALVSPPMILLPVGVVFLGVLRSARRWPERAYLIGGLCLLVLCIGGIWLNLYRVQAGLMSSISYSMAGFFWMPACLIAATTGVLLGCAPHELHRPAWLGSAAVICYLAAAVLVPLGFYTTLMNDRTGFASAALWAILPCVLAPTLRVTGNWIAFALRRRAR
ncbi:MAG: hypothetical protein ACLQGV_16360 [Bryobacteraceae bacterium]